MLRLRAGISIVTTTTGRRGMCYKMREWVDDEPHRHFRETIEWGTKKVAFMNGTVLAPEGYAFEFAGLPEMEDSAADIVHQESIKLSLS